MSCEGDGVRFGVLELETEGFCSGLTRDLGGDTKEYSGREGVCTGVVLAIGPGVGRDSGDGEEGE